jgi:hypothetical protein
MLGSAVLALKLDKNIRRQVQWLLLTENAMAEVAPST